MPSEDATIPQWAADLRVTVAEIRGETRSLVTQLPELLRLIEELRANTVPLSEHHQLMQRVDELWTRDLGARSEWDEVRQRLPVLWDERSRVRGMLALIGLLATATPVVIGIYAAIHR